MRTCTFALALLIAGCPSPIPGTDGGPERDAPATDVGTDAPVATDAPLDAPVLDAPPDAGLIEVGGWLRGYGSGGNERIQSVAATTTRIYVAGQADGHVDFGDAPDGSPIEGDFDSDGFVLALDREGRPLWFRRYGAAGRDFTSALTLDAEGTLYVAGSFRNGADLGDGVARTAHGTDVDVFVLALDASGELVWDAPITFGSMDRADEANRLAVDSTRHRLVVTGTVGGSTNFGGGLRTFMATGTDGFLLAIDTTTGTRVWDRTLLSRGSALTEGLAIDPATGDVLVTGNAGGDFEPVTGDVRASTGPGDGFVAVYDAAGAALRWIHVFGEDCTFCFAGPADAAFGAGSVAYVAGSSRASFTIGAFPFVTTGNNDAFVMSFATGGVLRWGVGVHGTGEEGIRGLALDGTTLHIVGGYQVGARLGEGTGATMIPDPVGGSDVYYVRVDDDVSAGTIDTASLAVFGSVAADDANEVVVVEPGFPIIGGWIGGTGAMAEGDSLGYFGTVDAYVWRHDAR